MGPGRGAGGRGFGGGRGAGGQGGRGHRHMFYATGLTGRQRAAASTSDLPPDAVPSPEEELQTLKAQSDAAEAELARIRQRIEELAPKAGEP